MPKASEFLLSAQSSDGGWGYRIGGMSFVEPTAAVLLALSGGRLDHGSPTRFAVERARDFVLALQHEDGGWGVGAVDSESGWMTAWAVYALTGLEATEKAVERGTEWLVKSEGLTVSDPNELERVHSLFQIDASLRGWPWQPGDASWVHPTAMAVLALCRTGLVKTERVGEGVGFLFDRALKGGGWNIGNPEMRSQAMPASIQDTSISLLALAAAGWNHEPTSISQGIEFLRRTLGDVHSPADLAWGAWALGKWRVDANEHTSRLSKMQEANGGWQDSPMVTAIALLAGAG